MGDQRSPRCSQLVTGRKEKPSAGALRAVVKDTVSVVKGSLGNAN